MRFISEHKGAFGIEPICRVLTEHGCPIAPSTYYGAARRPPSARARRDEQLKAAITRIHGDNYGVYGARKVWLALNREGISVARCTVERLMRELGLAGARRGKRKRTTVADPAAARPADLVQRRFSPPAPDRLWVADFTYVPTWSGTVYVSRSSSTPTPGGSWAGGLTPPGAPPWSSTPWNRRCGPATAMAGAAWPGWCVTPTREQYTSVTFTERLAAAGASGSVGTVGDAYDNALAESVIGLYKTELIKPHGPWRTPEQVEPATLHYVDWYNHQRLFQTCGDIPPAELETAYYRQNNA